MIPVILIIAAITVALALAFRWFERYRYTDAWRKSEFRGAAFGFLMWFGGIFGHRVPPPPQAKIEYATKPNDPTPPSGGAALSNDAPNEEE
jgi:hypothetical protein